MATLSLAVSVLLVGLAGAASNVHDRLPNVYAIDLDLPEEQRWVSVAKIYQYILPLLDEVIKLVIPNQAERDVANVLAADLDTYLPAPYAGEMRGLSNALNYSLGNIVLLNLIYDATSFCTSIVAEDVNGTIIHGRNLDYDYTDVLKNMTIIVHFTKNGQTVYSGVTWVGYVGLVTGQKPNAFTITMNERDQGAWWMNALMAILDRKAVPVSLLVRDTLADAIDFQAAVKKLAYTDTIANAYFIVGGVSRGEGVVITKDRLGSVDIWKLATELGRWFLLETNYDHWTTPPPDDDRRDPGNAAMNKVGQTAITPTTLYEVLSVQPVLNNITVYTAIMSASKPELLYAIIRDLP